MLHFKAWKTTLILGVCLLGILFALPNALPSDARKDLPGFLPNKTINLGLDLRGGSHLLFQVQMDEVFQQRLQNVEASIREKFRSKHIGYIGLRTMPGQVVVRVRDPADMDQALKLVRDLAQPISGGSIGLGGKPDIDVRQGSNNQITVKLTPDEMTNLRTSTVAQSIEVVRRRVDESGTKEASVQRQGNDRIIVDVPGVGNPDDIKRLISQTARLTFQAVDDSVSVQQAQEGRIPPTDELLPYLNPEKAGRQYEVVQKRVVLSGEDLKSARTSQDESGLPAVAFTMNPRGARVFADYSTKNVGKRFAIILDNKVISAPVIRTPIIGGSGEISGGFANFQEANELAVLLRAGALPASLQVVQERTVGPSLGKDSIDSGVTASIIGVTAVFLFMLLCYGLFGFFANIAMLVNLTLLVGIMTFLGATLTLPGIAGIALTLGMAVDANVLIFERMREEMKNGKSALSSMESGYQKAMATITDANLTTLIAALVMFFLGAGPVKGFAVTLAIGIFTSVFTAVSLSRLIIAFWYRTLRPKRLPI
jgi:preprotein translocase subunit SecD